MNQIQKLHVGVYGIIKNGNNVLVVRKSRGPYKGLYDLPGGKLLHGEPILTGLRREILEETGIESQSFRLMDNFAFTTSYLDHNSTPCELYHIALIYTVERAEIERFNPLICEEDVLGSLWVSQNKLNINNSSPLVLKGLGI